MDSTNKVQISPEVAAMAAKERAKWLTVAEAQSLRKAWQQISEAMDEMVTKFDADPESGSEALLFIVMSGLMVHGFTSKAVEAANKLRDLHPRPGDAA